jgi:hypothetical protein
VWIILSKRAPFRELEFAARLCLTGLVRMHDSTRRTLRALLKEHVCILDMDDLDHLPYDFHSTLLLEFYVIIGTPVA